MEEQPDSIASPSNRSSRKFSGDDLSRWGWTEPSVWTNPMLATLEHNGVRGGKWHSLIRYPNAYFAELGLFSITHAFARESQSCHK